MASACRKDFSQFLMRTWRGGDLIFPHISDAERNAIAFEEESQGRSYTAMRYSQSRSGRVQRELLIYFPLFQA